MHQTRQETTTMLPIRRKGTKYVARALIAPQKSVPVVVAVRDMLGIAHTAREVREMIKDKLVKINWRPVFDYRESVQLFNLLSVSERNFALSINETGKFYFEPVKEAKTRLCKVIGKKLLAKKVIQINMHDGTNAIDRKGVSVNDSVWLDEKNKVVRHVKMADAKDAFVFSGKYAGKNCTIKSVKDNKANVLFKGKEGAVELDLRSIIAT